MSNETTTVAPYNHEAESTFEAVGLTDAFQTKLDEFITDLNENKPTSLSDLTERAENTFNSRELALMVAHDFIEQATRKMQTLDSMLGSLSEGVAQA